MEPGIRTHKTATLRISICEALPDHMREGTREIVNLRSDSQRKGYASALMHQVCGEADRTGVILIVQPGQFDAGMTTEQLEKWYAKFGFVALPKDEGNPTVMARWRYGKLVSVH